MGVLGGWVGRGGNDLERMKGVFGVFSEGGHLCLDGWMIPTLLHCTAIIEGVALDWHFLHCYAGERFR